MKLSLLRSCSQTHCRVLKADVRILAANLHFALIPEAVVISTVCSISKNLLFEVLGMQLVRRDGYLLDSRLEDA
jgi:hypothetical protein